MANTVLKEETYIHKYAPKKQEKRSSKNKEQKFKYSNKRSKGIRINKP